MNPRSCTFLAFLLLAFLVSGYSQEATMRDCPRHKEHADQSSHHAVVAQHSDEAMGFSHETTTHHFRMTPSGGTIEVTANDPADKSSTEAIRSHLEHIATMFGNGDLSAPMFVHDGTPPGVTTMELLKGKISYKYKDMPSGGMVTIESSDPVALAAIHDFLRFQISDHQTGDSLAVVNADR